MKPYQLAQSAVTDLKSAIYTLLQERADSWGLKNVEIGRALGVYFDREGRHAGQIP